MDIAASLKTLFTEEWGLATVPTFCTNDIGHDTNFEMFDANAVTPQVAINVEVATSDTNIIGALLKIIHDVNLIVYIKPIRYDATTVATARTLFQNIKDELDRILRTFRYTVFPDMQPQGWKFRTKKLEEPIIFEAAQTVKITEYSGEPYSGAEPYGGSDYMLKSVYDPDLDNIVDNSEKLEGSTKAQVQDHAPQAHTLASHSSKAHTELTGVTADQHHAQSHTLASHSTKAHSELTGVGADDHHARQHALGSALDHTGTGTIKTTLSFAVTGTLTTGTDKAPTIVAPCALTITKVKIVVKTAPTGASIKVDVNKGGVTIFTNQANRPEIAIGETQDDSGTPDVTALAESDKITIDIDQIGSTVAGADLTVEVVTTQAVVFT